MPHLRLPPFGKTLFDLIVEGKIPDNDVYLFIGNNAWQKASDFKLMRSCTLCLPPNKNPLNYDWPVRGCDMLIFDSDGISEHLIESLVKCLFRDGANIVRYLSPEFLLTVFKKDF